MEEKFILLVFILITGFIYLVYGQAAGMYELVLIICIVLVFNRQPPAVN